MASFAAGPSCSARMSVLAPGGFGGQDDMGTQSPPLEGGVEPAREVLLLVTVYGMITVHMPQCPGIKRSSAGAEKPPVLRPWGKHFLPSGPLAGRQKQTLLSTLAPAFSLAPSLLLCLFANKSGAPPQNLESQASQVWWPRTKVVAFSAASLGPLSRHMELVSLSGGSGSGSFPRKGVGDLTQKSDQSVESGFWGRRQPHTRQAWVAWVPWVVGDSGVVSKLWHRLAPRWHPPACRERSLFITQLCLTL